MTPRSLSFVGVVTGAVLWLSGCEAGMPAVEALVVTSDTIDGVPNISVAGEPPRWRLELLADLGQLGSRGEPFPDEFGFVSAIAVGPSTQLYVADLFASQITAFDSTGTYLSTIGRPGEGPGEFGQIFSIQWMGDLLATFDVEHGRIGFFRDGRWIESQPAVGSLTASPVTHRLYPVGADELYQWAYVVQDGVTRPSWRRHMPDSAARDVPRRALRAEPKFPDRVVCTLGRGFSWFEHPLATKSYGHPAPGANVYIALSDPYRVTTVTPGQDTVRVLRREVEGPPLSDERWAPLEERFDRWMEDKDASQCEPPALLRPERVPPIQSIQVSTNGELWVERAVEFELSPTGTIWEIFSHDGELLGSVPGLNHDRERTVPWIGEHHIAWVTREEFDLPRVYLARILR